MLDNVDPRAYMYVKKPEDTKLWPSRTHKTDAGLDLKVSTDVTLLPDVVQKVGTGVHVQIPVGYVGFVIPRSSTVDVELDNTIGVIDAWYRGEIKLKLRSKSSEPVFIAQYAAIVQLVILPVITPQLLFVDKLDDSPRGDDGFGKATAKLGVKNA